MASSLVAAATGPRDGWMMQRLSMVLSYPFRQRLCTGSGNDAVDDETFPADESHSFPEEFECRTFGGGGDPGHTDPGIMGVGRGAGTPEDDECLIHGPNIPFSSATLHSDGGDVVGDERLFVWGEEPDELEDGLDDQCILDRTAVELLPAREGESGDLTVGFELDAFHGLTIPFPR